MDPRVSALRCAAVAVMTVLEGLAAVLLREGDAVAEVRVVGPHPPVVITVPGVRDPLVAVVAHDDRVRAAIAFLHDERHRRFSGVKEHRTFLTISKATGGDGGGAKAAVGNGGACRALHWHGDVTSPSRSHTSVQ